MSSTTVAKRDSSREIILPRYDEMCRAIAQCHRIDDVKKIRDKAQALQAYVRKANNREAEVQFAEIKIEAERRAGELLSEMAAKGERKTKGRPSENSDTVSRLSDLGVSPKESERFQQAAAAPADKVKEAYAEARKTQVPVTSAQIRNLTKQPDFTPIQRADHERLWRVLRALEQIADQDVSPKQWLSELPDYMVERVRNHVKLARPWLEQLFSEWEKHHAN